MSEKLSASIPTDFSQTQMLNKLWELQISNSVISDQDIDDLSRQYQISKVEVEGVVSFYHFFHRKPTGKFTIYLNNSIVSDMKGFQRVKEAFERETKTSFGSVDRTGNFGLFLTPCIGLSDQEPAALINFYPFTNLNSIKVKEIIHALLNGSDPAQLCDSPVSNIYTPAENKTVFFKELPEGDALKNAQKMGQSGVIDSLKRSELTGRGGANFPTHLKWSLAKSQTATPKYVICNADEGEPGTFKDRVLISTNSKALIEGMLICGYTIGATEGIIYLRGEYRWLEPKLNKAIDDFRKNGLYRGI